MANIDPKRLSLNILGNTFGDMNSKLYSDAPIVCIYRVRTFDSTIFGPSLQAYTLGCMYRCAMCWVHDEALSAKEGVFVKKQIEALPKSLRAKSLGALFSDSESRLFDKVSENSDEETARKIVERIGSRPDNILFQGQYFAADLYSYLRDRVRLREKKDGKKVAIVHSGGAPTLYKGYLLETAKLAKRDRIKLGVVTEGFHFGEDRNYLGDFENAELQKVLQWAVTIKNATPETFEQLTKVRPEFSEHHFIALTDLLAAGFMAVPMVLSNTFANGDQLVNAVERLYDSLNLGGKFPGLLSIDGVYFGQYVDDGDAQRRKLNKQGYRKTSPGMVDKAIRNYFRKKKTPVRKFSPARPVMLHGRKTIEEIIQTLSTSRKINKL